MHEISMCYSALELIEQQARQHHARRVTAVWLEIGALSCIEESALRFVLSQPAGKRWRKDVNCTLRFGRPKPGAGSAAPWWKSSTMTPGVRSAAAIICEWMTATVCS